MSMSIDEIDAAYSPIIGVQVNQKLICSWQKKEHMLFPPIVFYKTPEAIGVNVNQHLSFF